MDEPLGALDADFRTEMRAELKRLHMEQGATTVYVTHDQVEAMAMGDRIVVMSEAVVQQAGSPAEVYYRPSNLFVARFIGSPGMNLLTGSYVDRVVQLAGARYTPPAEWEASLGQSVGREGKVIVGFRPESAWLSDEGALAGEVYGSDRHGAYDVLQVSMDGELVGIRSPRGVDYAVGEPARFDIDPEMVRFFDPETQRALVRSVHHE
jgi:multiple sugar transport system ATP-binding protein